MRAFTRLTLTTTAVVARRDRPAHRLRAERPQMGHAHGELLHQPREQPTSRRPRPKPRSRPAPRPGARSPPPTSASTTWAAPTAPAGHEQRQERGVLPQRRRPAARSPKPTGGRTPAAASIDADIVFYDGGITFFTGSSGCSGGLYIEDTAAHEFGHALGLGHSSDPDATMYYVTTWCSTSGRSLAPDDLAGVEALYPASSAPRNVAPSVEPHPPGRRRDLLGAGDGHGHRHRHRHRRLGRERRLPRQRQRLRHRHDLAVQRDAHQSRGRHLRAHRGRHRQRRRDGDRRPPARSWSRDADRHPRQPPLRHHGHDDTRARGRASTAAEGYAIAATPPACPWVRSSGSPGRAPGRGRRRRPTCGRLQRAASDRVMAAWYGSSFTIDVNVSGTQPRQLAIYTADYDNGGRQQRFDLIDAATGAVLDSRTLSAFTSGQYLRLERPRPRADPGHAPGRAERRRQRDPDRGRRRDGRGVGERRVPDDRHVDAGHVEGNVRRGGLRDRGGHHEPSRGYATHGHRAECLDVGDVDDRRPGAAARGSDRVMAAWYGNTFTIDVNVTGSQPRQIAVYSADYDNWGRQQRFDVVDAATGAVLDTRTLTAFTAASTCVWTVQGHVLIRVTRLAGPNAVVSGVLIGGAARPQGRLTQRVSRSSRPTPSRRARGRACMAAAAIRSPTTPGACPHFSSCCGLDSTRGRGPRRQRTFGLSSAAPPAGSWRPAMAPRSASTST